VPCSAGSQRLRPAQIALLLIPFVGPAFAEDDRSKRVREDLDRQLSEMVKLPAASVEVVFDGIDSTRYKLLEASFALDDKPIPFTPSTKVLYAGEVQPGKHTLTATFSYEAPAVNSGSIKFKVPGKFIFTAQRGILMRVRARIEVDDAAEPAKRLQLVGNAETDLRAKLEDSLPPPAQGLSSSALAKELEAEDKGAIRYGKKAARDEAPAEEDAKSRPHKRRSRFGTKVALASPKPVVGHPGALKTEAHLPATSDAAVDAVAAPTQPAETPTAPSGKTEDLDAGAVASSDSDGGFPLAPLAEVTSTPPAPPSTPAAPTKATGATGMAFFGAALAAIGLLVFALARRGR
jgi:hypothetical protein